MRKKFRLIDLKPIQRCWMLARKVLTIFHRLRQLFATTEKILVDQCFQRKCQFLKSATEEVQLGKQSDIFLTLKHTWSSVTLPENWLDSVLNVFQFFRIPAIFAVFAEIQRTFKFLRNEIMGRARIMIILKVLYRSLIFSRTAGFIVSRWLIFNIFNILVGSAFFVSWTR